MVKKDDDENSPFTTNEKLLLKALDHLRRASEISDPAKKTKLHEQAHRLQRLAEAGIMEDLRRLNLAARHSGRKGTAQ